MNDYIRIPCAGSQKGCLATVTVKLALFADLGELRRVVGRVGFHVIEPEFEQLAPAVMLACTACMPKLLTPEQRQTFEERFEVRRGFMS